MYGVNRGRLEQVAEEMGVHLNIVEDMDQATLIVTSKNIPVKNRRVSAMLRTAIC